MPISPSRAVLCQHNTGQRRRLWRDYGALGTGLRAVGGGVPTSTAPEGHSGAWEAVASCVFVRFACACQYPI